MWNHTPSAAQTSSNSGSGSTAPAAAVPAFAHTTVGVHPSDRSAMIAVETAPGSIRPAASVGSTRIRSGAMPTIRAARICALWL